MNPRNYLTAKLVRAQSKRKILSQSQLLVLLLPLENLPILMYHVWGPARFNATNGAHYYMTFIDDYSRHCTIKLLNKKSEAAEMVKGYLAFIERHLGLLPKATSHGLINAESS